MASVLLTLPPHLASADETTSTTVEPAPDVRGPDLAYDFSSIEIGGGGYVTGLVTGPTGEVYARTDVGGAYRWEEADSRWEQLITEAGVPEPSNDDYRVESLAVSPSDGRVVYAAVGNALWETAGRILRSTDGGRTWRDGGHRFAISGNANWRWGGERLAVDPANPDIVLFGTRTDGLWRSTDGGTTWSKTSLPFKTFSTSAVPAGVKLVSFQPGGPIVGGASTTVWAGSQNLGVYRSTDAGATWTLVHPVSKGAPRDLSFGPDGQLYVVVHGSPSHVVRIDTATAQVTTITPPVTATFATVAADPHQPGRIFVGHNGVGDGRLWRSSNGGATWDRLNTAIDGGAWTGASDIDGWMSAGKLSFDPARPGKVWFAEGMGVWTSTDLNDTEVTFDFTSKGIEELVSNDAVKPTGGALLTAHWDRPVFRHEEGTPAQLALTGRFNAAWDLDVADDDPSVVAAVVSDNRFCCEADGLAHQSGVSTDGGRTWQRFPSLEDGTHPAGLAFGNIAISTGDHDNIVWVPSNRAAIHRTTDGGRTWQPATYPGEEPHQAHHLSRRVLVADPVAPGTFYVLDSKGIHRSADGGATWVKTANTGVPDWWARRYNATLTAVPGRSGELLLSMGELQEGSFGLFRSTDAGETWTELPGITDAGTMDVGPATTAGGPPTLFATGTVGETKGVWRSSDDGATWQLVTTAPLGIHQGIKVVTADPDVPGKVYVGFSGTGFATGQPRAEVAGTGSATCTAT